MPGLEHCQVSRLLTCIAMPGHKIETRWPQECPLNENFPKWYWTNIGISNLVENQFKTNQEIGESCLLIYFFTKSVF